MSEPLHSYAEFMATTDENGRDIPEKQRDRIRVHFNPETLDITFSNTLQRGSDNQPAQVVNETTAKLNMELIFDTSLDGTDVRVETHKIARMMAPTQDSNDDEVKVPSIVVFEWGTIRFEGYIDSYKERIEFFSSEGVPLRAIVTLSITQQQRSFTPGTGQNKRQNNDLTLNGNAPVQRLSANMTITAQNLGDPGAAKNLAAQNRIENLRHPEVNEIMVVNTPGRDALNLTAPVGPDLGIGALTSTGETTSQFAGLRNRFSASANLTPRIRLSPNAGGDIGQSPGLRGTAGVGIGGQVTAGLNTNLTADVGADADIELGILFED
ncbi:MAG: hypothetical protein GY761_00230 [Hyphomicrobiales bacterium]|nr:hypothetical protein [Hyphomicrobiales bacterium]